MDWDVFISHASEDKEAFARPLARALEAKGLRVWFDEFTLTLGDSLRRSIDRGLAQSRYGVVILSPNFFAKEWPQKELDGLAAREVSGEKVILPIWHNITAEQIREYSPILADRVAVLSERGLEHVVEELLRVIKPAPEVSQLHKLWPELPDKIRQAFLALIRAAAGPGPSEGSLPQRQRDSSGVVERQKVELVKEHEEARTEAIRNSVNALDNYEKAVLREFFIQKRNAIMVHEDNVAVVSLLRKGIIHTIGEGEYLLGVGWVCPVSLSPTAEAIIKGSSPQVLGFPPGAPTPEQVREIQRARPGFAVDIEAFRPQ